MRKLVYSVAFVGLAACGDPVANLQRLSEQDIPEENSTIEVVAAPVPEGTSLLQRLMGTSDPESATGEMAIASPVPEEATSLEGTSEIVESSPVSSAEAEQPEAIQKKTGLLAMLTRAAPPKEDIVPTPEEEAVKIALLPQDAVQPEATALPATPEQEPEQDTDPVAGTKHKSIFGINKAKTKAAKPAAVSEIPPGTRLPYGKVARICGLPKRELGKQVAQYPEKRPKHRVYDSAVGSTGPRTFYVTGFDDGCARQFTASLAMFGSASMHEQLRYGLPSEVQPYSDTDKAYEKLKSRVCSVPRKKPCGAKVSRMEKDTVFLSIYERFGSNPRWTNLLLHNGDVLAQDQKGG